MTVCNDVFNEVNVSERFIWLENLYGQRITFLTRYIVQFECRTLFDEYS